MSLKQKNVTNREVQHSSLLFSLFFSQ